MKTVALRKEEVHSGYLILVNREHPIKQETLQDKMKLTPFHTEYEGIRLERLAATLLSEVIHSVGCSKVIVPVSGYRSRAEQEKLFDDSLKERGREFTEQYVAYPDCSEHQTGLAIDLGQNRTNIDYIAPSLPYNGIFSEFRRKAVHYGFIERYEKGKEAITGISHEPWHFRYVGYPHAQIMKQHHFCLEEYIQFLRDFSRRGQPYKFNSGKRTFEIFYTLAEEGQTVIELPESTMYQISGNNIDGFIVTLWGA